MELYPLRLSNSVKSHVFGGRALADRYGRAGLPDGPVAETWEVSDVDGEIGVVRNGPLAGRSLRDLMGEAREQLVGAGWTGSTFPVLTKFIDASGVLPVHVHPDDATAQRRGEGPVGKTEAWHILEAAPGATALCGVRAGVTSEQLHEALLAQDFDAVLRRLPVRPGETIYVPGGTLHSFGPDTLVYEIEQTADVQQHAMRWNMEDGSPVPGDEWRANLEALMDVTYLEPRPEFTPGVWTAVGDGVTRTVLCTGPYFTLERWTAGTVEPMRWNSPTATVLSNVGARVTVTVGDWSEPLAPAETLLIPAVCGELRIDGPADVLIGYHPALQSEP